MTKFAYKPENVITTFVDKYGDTRTIHRPRGSSLRVCNDSDTPVLLMNRAAAYLLGKKVRARRLTLGLTQKQLCELAGFVDVNPKQRIYGIETAKRGGGVRLGTLFALAHALRCEPQDILPTTDEVLSAAGVGEKTKTGLAAE